MTFVHQDAGTPEQAWAAAIEGAEPAVRRVGTGFFAGLDHLVVVAAHPDDETLGAGGLLATAYASGIRTTVVVATSGEASHPDSSTHRPEQLAHLREAETLAAVAELDPGATVHFLRLPDGRLADPPHEAALRDALAAVLAPPEGAAAAGGASLVVAPWRGDRHPDHEAAAAAAAAAATSAAGAAAAGAAAPAATAAAAGAATAPTAPAAAPLPDGAEGWPVQVWAYPIWAWHWGDPEADDVPWARAVMVPLSDEAFAAKTRALALHVTQVEPLSALPGDEVLLHEGMLEHFRRPFETFVEIETTSPTSPPPPTSQPSPSPTTPTTTPTSQPSPTSPSPASQNPSQPPAAPGPGTPPADAGLDAYFEQLHRGADDPWGFETRWYEQRKRAVLLASLPDPDYGTVLELGCSTGVLSRELAARATTAFRGVDVSEAALDRARARNSDLPHARFDRMHVPAEWPDGPVDLVVLSELGYYLEPAELDLLARRVADDLTPGGAFVLCHWRHPVDGRPWSGDQVHARLIADEAFDSLAHHVEDDFVLDVLVHRPAVSVARREGIL